MATRVQETIKSRLNSANLDDNYKNDNSPYSTISEAKNKIFGDNPIEEKHVGLTILVKENGWTEAKEYWVQPLGTMPEETYGFVEKGAGTTDYNDLDNKPTVGDGTNTDLSIAGHIKVTASTASGNTAGVTIMPGQNTGDIEMEFTLPKGADGAPGNNGSDGQDGAPGHNPCLGRFNVLPTLSPNPFADARNGDYIYFDTTDSQTSEPVTYIYHFDGTNWDAQGTAVDVSNLTFNSGQSVIATPIKNLNGNNDQTAQGVLSAEAGKLLADEVFGTPILNMMPTSQRLDGITTLASSYSQGWAAWTSNINRPITVIKNDDYFTVSYGAATVSTYCGLRTDVLPTMEVGARYIASFYAKNNNGNTTPIAFFVRTTGGTYALNRIELTDDWAKYELEFEYSSQQVTRFQIGPGDPYTFGLQAASFCVKNFALVKKVEEIKEGLVDKVSKLRDKVSELEGEVGNVLDKTNSFANLSGKKIAIIGDSISTNGITGIDSNVPEIVIGQNDVGVELSAYLTYYDVQGGLTINGHTFTSDEIGTEITFTPTAEDVGKVVGKPNNYNDNSVKVWWEVVNEILGTTTIPVCWSGSSITSHEASSNLYKCSYAWHESQIRKCGVRVEGSMNRVAPDIIIIYRGTNDFTHVENSPNTYARLTDGYFDAVTFQYPSTDVLPDGKWGYKEGLVLTISKLRDAYPHAKIFLCTLNVFKRINYSHFPTNNGVNTLPQYNNAIREVADYMGCGVIEFDKDGITFENCYPTYISDSATRPTHPNNTGHLVMGEKAALSLIMQYSDMI